MGRRGVRRWWLVGALAMAVFHPGCLAAEEGEMRTATAWQSVGISGGGAMYQPTFSPADAKWLLLSCDMSGAYRSLDRGRSWEMIHYRQLLGSTSVRPAFHPTDPTVAYAVSGWGGGLKVTRDKGATWREVAGAPPGITAIALDPGRPNLMLVATHESNFRSADRGKTWQECTGLTGEVLGFHFDQTSPARKRVCFAGTGDGLFRSDDGGLTWRGLPAPEPGKVIAFAGGSNAQKQACTLYCTVEGTLQDGDYHGGVFRSEDRGMTWVSMMGEGLPRTVRTRRFQAAERATQFEYLAASDADPSIAYAAAPRRSNVYRSDDGGKSWRPLLDLNMSSPGLNVSPNYLLDERGRAGDNVSGLGVSPADANLVAVSDWMSCYVSRNGGKTWASSHTRSAEKAGRRGPGMRWKDNGLVVTTVWHYYLDPFEPKRHYIAYTDIGYARSTDAGKTWYWSQERPLRNTTYEIAFDPEVPGKLWAACADLHDIPNMNVISGRHYWPQAGGGVAVSTDHGVTWQDTSRGLPGKPIVSVVLDPKSKAGARTLYASAFEDGVYKSTDDGQSWVKKSVGLGAPDTNMRVCRIILHPDGTLFCLVTARRGDQDQYLPDGPGLYRSRDGGEHWECITGSQPLLWPKDFDVDPRDSRVIYLGAADAGNEQGGLYKTTDGGATWGRIARKGWDCFGATVSVHHPDWVYLCIAEGADDAGLWLSKDAGKTWQALDGMPFRNAQRVAFDPNDPTVIYVCTFGGSVWKGPAE
jgi:photosystem II stability/assembly factor-like uncharacterized protein